MEGQNFYVFYTNIHFVEVIFGAAFGARREFAFALQIRLRVAPFRFTGIDAPALLQIRSRVALLEVRFIDSSILGIEIVQLSQAIDCLEGPGDVKVGGAARASIAPPISAKYMSGRMKPTPGNRITFPRRAGCRHRGFGPFPQLEGREELPLYEKTGVFSLPPRKVAWGDS